MRSPSLPFAPSTRWSGLRTANAPLLLALVLSGCTSGTEPGDDSPPDMPGIVSYALASPNELEGALLFSVPAAAVLSVPVADNLTELISHQDGDLLYLAVVYRFDVETPTFELEVANVDAPPELALLAVAGPDDRLRSLAGYSLELLP